MAAWRATWGNRARRSLAIVVALCAVSAWTVAAPTRGDAHSASATRYRQECAEPRVPAKRDPANPLALASPPGANPLTGARFFVPGPAHGAAAGAIAELLGLNPKTLSQRDSWLTFSRSLQTGPLHAKLAANPSLASQAAELSKIAAQPEVQRISSYSYGGGPGAIFKQTEKIFCQVLQADPQAIPIFNTAFLHTSLGGCPSAAQIRAYDSVFHRRVSEMANAIDRRPAVLLLEVDAIGTTRCISQTGGLSAWEADLRYEINAMRVLPHAVVYIEGGYSDTNTVAYTAKVLNAIGVSTIRGFYTNDTHNNWTSQEVKWATAIAKRTHGAHFVVNTASNGRGPLRNANRRQSGNEDLCNPPGRALGPQDTTETGFALADAWIWTHPPGNSSGCGGGPAAGVFWPAYAEGLAARANQKLGPGYPSRPY
jgi:endoglucanase